MRVLVASDHGELAWFGVQCDTGCGCGCACSFAGASTGKPVTTAQVADRPELTPELFVAAIRDAVLASGRNTEFAQEIAAEQAADIMAVADCWPLGAVVHRNGVPRTTHSRTERQTGGNGDGPLPRRRPTEMETPMQDERGTAAVDPAADDEGPWSTDLTAADKERLLGEIDVAGAPWQRTDPPGERLPDAIELAIVEHKGEKYVLFRTAAAPERVLLFDRAEWRAYRRAVLDGEFDV